MQWIQLPPPLELGRAQTSLLSSGISSLSSLRVVTTGGPYQLLLDSKPLVSQDFIPSRPELSQTSDPSKTTRTEPRDSASRSRCWCVCLVRRTARLATFGTPCTRGASCLLLLSPEAIGHSSTLARLLVCELQSLAPPCIKHVRLRAKRLRCEAHSATPLETLQPSLAGLR